MEKTSLEELKAYLTQSNEEFRNLVAKHSEYERLINEIEAKPHLTEQDEIEEHRLKKLKLHAKDLMQEMLKRSRAQEVA